MHPLLETLAARSAAQIVVDTFSGGETDWVAMPWANNTRAKRAMVFNISVQQWTTHVVAGGIDSVHHVLMRNESLRTQQ